jgi:hypothetical protein
MARAWTRWGALLKLGGMNLDMLPFRAWVARVTRFALSVTGWAGRLLAGVKVVKQELHVPMLKELVAAGHRRQTVRSALGAPQWHASQRQLCMIRHVGSVQGTLA